MEPAVSKLKLAIWLYFILLMLEGALRKWIFPSLADPILVIRDPLVLWILIKAWQHGLINFNYYVISMIFIGIVGIYTAYFLGHGNIAVALYGARILLLHFPLIFVIGKICNIEDAIKIGKVTLFIAIPMTILIILQFYSPQTALINITVGGEAGGGFSGVGKVFRPPGIFSFINGNALFYSFTACFVLYFWFNYKTINRLLLVLATLSLLLAIPFSISRALLFQVIVSMIFAAIAIAMKPKYLTGMLFVIGGIVISFLLLGSSSFFTTATEVFTQRLTSANQVEGGMSGVILNRFLGGMLDAIYSSSNQPLFGYGIGMGTNAGSMILKGGRFFLISEGEWGRILGELGPIMGMGVIILRIKLALHVSFKSYSSLLTGNLMPWMLLSFGVLAIAQGSWSQPTSLGFCTLISGLIIASLKD